MSTCPSLQGADSGVSAILHVPFTLDVCELQTVVGIASDLPGTKLT